MIETLLVPVALVGLTVGLVWSYPKEVLVGLGFVVPIFIGARLDVGPLTLAISVVLAQLVVYGLMCRWFPFTACLMCKDSKRKGPGRVFESARKRAWKRCPWCKGTGVRRRWGRIIWAYFSNTRKKASD